MKFWIDAQLPPTLAEWLTENFEVEAYSIKSLGLRDSRDIDIFQTARNSDVVIITKDIDFIQLVQRYGIPPQILWVTCGNVTNRNLKRIFSGAFPKAMILLEQNEAIVEVSSFAFDYS
jgi:predicted nuclease of predicted toxin-antitoxin system